MDVLGDSVIDCSTNSLKGRAVAGIVDDVVFCFELNFIWLLTLDLRESPLASESPSVFDSDLNLILARTEDVPDNGDSGRLNPCVSDLEDEQSLL